LPDELIRRSIKLGITKFNVNTEVRQAYIQALKESFVGTKPPDLLDLMRNGTSAMEAVVTDKLRLFGSVGKS
jgi:tagatose 1,6-diphosphate aldolase GatY/KbaY